MALSYLYYLLVTKMKLVITYRETSIGVLSSASLVRVCRRVGSKSVSERFPTVIRSIIKPIRILVHAMHRECFNCATPASGRYTLVLEGSNVFEDTAICEECLSAFRSIEWIDIHDEPVLVQGRDTGR
jgi:hypothetical protein